MPHTQKQPASNRIRIISASLILLAVSVTRDPFFIIFGGGACIGIAFVLQEETAKFLSSRSTSSHVKLAITLFPTLAISSCIVLMLNPITSRNQALRNALGTDPPPDITDLHVRESSFTDYQAFVFFRSSSNSIKQLLSTPIYKRSDYPARLDMSHSYFEDLAHMGIITNLIVYRRTDIAPKNGGGYLKVDPEYRFVFAGVGVD
jgi:hypothetical protein